MKKDKLAILYKKYELTKDDSYQHKHYLIITRQGIDKIQAKEKINISYEVIKCEKDFAVVKAVAGVGEYKIQTFGSAMYGGKVKVDNRWKSMGTTESWYIMEIAEKRAMSRAVLKLTGFYELGVFGEDESEDFKKGDKATPDEEPKKKPYPVANYEKGAKAIHKGPSTINDIKEVYMVSAAAEKVLKEMVLKLANKEFEQEVDNITETQNPNN